LRYHAPAGDNQVLEKHADPAFAITRV